MVQVIFINYHIFFHWSYFVEHEYNWNRVTSDFKRYLSKEKIWKGKSYRQKTEIQKSWIDQYQHDYWVTITTVLNFTTFITLAPFIWYVQIWAQLLAFVKLYMLVLFFVSKYNHFKTKYIECLVVIKFLHRIDICWTSPNIQ